MTLKLSAPVARQDAIELDITPSAAVSSVRLPVGARFPRQPRGGSGFAVTDWSVPDLALVPVCPVGARFPRRTAEEAQLRVLLPVVWETPRNRRPVGARSPRH